MINIVEINYCNKKQPRLTVHYIKCVGHINKSQLQL